MTPHLPRFLIHPDAIGADHVRLDAREARHARVRRLRAGAAVALFDGKGRSWLGRIDRLSPRGAEVRLTERRPDGEGESRLDLTLAVALLKADKLDWVIAKATELGVTRVRPFISQHSLARPSAARRARWEQLALGAAKQSGRSVLPRIDAPVGFEQALDDAAPCRLLWWEAADGGARGPLGGLRPHPPRVAVMVGPEGGFAEHEVEAARAAGYRLVGLGPRILRAETAAVVAVALCQHLWGDL